jgi:hypothetical protein
MQDKELLLSLLECEHEDDAIAILNEMGLLEDKNSKRWSHSARCRTTSR